MRTLSLLSLLVCLISPVGQAGTTPRVEVDFDSDGPSGQELIHARAEFHSHGSETWEALAAITGYPEHHPWITDARLVRQTNDRQQEFLIEFSFPWPVGRRWSRIEVQKDGPRKLAWRQLAGSLQSNQGQLSFFSAGGQVRIDYRASIDLGLPDALTRHYRKKFVLEFIGAIYDRVSAAQPATDLPVGG